MNIAVTIGFIFILGMILGFLIFFLRKTLHVEDASRIDPPVENEDEYTSPIPIRESGFYALDRDFFPSGLHIPIQIGHSLVDALSPGAIRCHAMHLGWVQIQASMEI